MAHKRDIVIISIFLYLTIISTQPSILESTEVSLAGHMILEHLFFFLLGATSVMSAEVILKYLVIISPSSSNNKNIKNRLKNEEIKLNQTALRLAILSKWKHILSKIFTINQFKYRYMDNSFYFYLSRLAHTFNF